jgi:hypothetical protein
MSLADEAAKAYKQRQDAIDAVVGDGNGSGAAKDIMMGASIINTLIEADPKFRQVVLMLVACQFRRHSFLELGSVQDIMAADNVDKICLMLASEGHNLMKGRANIGADEVQSILDKLKGDES